MKLSLFSGRSHPALARETAGRLGIEPAERLLETFPDGEMHFRALRGLAGHDVFIVQATSPPAERHLFELLLMADGCRRAGAARITAVIPYFGYARQDRRTAAGEAVGARLAADLLSTRLDRIVAFDLHNPAVEGFFSIPVEHRSFVEPLAAFLKGALPEDPVLVAPDLGAVKRVQRFGDLLNAPVAYVHKERSGAERVRVRHVAGAVADRTPVLIDDMISTGGTAVSAMEALAERGCRLPATVVASHVLLAGNAAERLAAQPIAQVVCTNSIRGHETRALALLRVDISGLLADAISRIHGGA